MDVAMVAFGIWLTSGWPVVLPLLSLWYSLSLGIQLPLDLFLSLRNVYPCVSDKH